MHVPLKSEHQEHTALQVDCLAPTLSLRAHAACDSRGGGWLTPFAVTLLHRMVSVSSSVTDADASSPLLPPSTWSAKMATWLLGLHGLRLLFKLLG